jgi:hypothetical protein
VSKELASKPTNSKNQTTRREVNAVVNAHSAGHDDALMFYCIDVLHLHKAINQITVILRKKPCSLCTLILLLVLCREVALVPNLSVGEALNSWHEGQGCSGWVAALPIFLCLKLNTRHACSVFLISSSHDFVRVVTNGYT